MTRPKATKYTHIDTASIKLYVLRIDNVWVQHSIN